MLTFISNLALSALISASSLTNPTTPKANAFDASAFVTLDNQVRVSVVKGADAPAEIVLRNANNLVIFRQSLNRKDEKAALKLNVDELTDGKYELEVKSGGTSIKKELNLSTQAVQQNSRVVAMQ